MAFGNFNQQPKIITKGNTIGYEPKLWNEKVSEIKAFLEKNESDLTSLTEQEQKTFETMKAAFPTEYEQALAEIETENSKEQEPSKKGKETITREVISQNLKESGSSSKLAA